MKNNIDIVFAVKYFSQPASIGELGTKTTFFKKCNDLREFGVFTKHVQVFCIAVNTGIVKHGKSSTEHVFGATFIQQLKGFFVKSVSFLFLFDCAYHTYIHTYKHMPAYCL